MGITRSFYLMNSMEAEYVKIFLNILRSGLTKGQVGEVVDIAAKALAEPVKPRGFWGEEIPEGWRQHWIGDKLVWIEKIGDQYTTVSWDGSGAIDEYRAACKEQGIKLKIA